MAGFEMKAMQPLFVNQEITLVGKPTAGDDDGGSSSGCIVWALAPDGSIAQELVATFVGGTPRASL